VLLGKPKISDSCSSKDHVPGRVEKYVVW